MKNSNPLLKVDNIDVSYGRIDVLWDISMEIREGTVVALVGMNGAGKSTLVKTITGLLRPKKGAIYFEDKRIDGLDPWRIAELGIIQVPEGRRLFTRMTVKENLLMGCYLKERRKKAAQKLKEIYQLFPILAEREKQEAGTLSGGEQQMLAIARALMAEPKLLIFDEVTLGLAPKVREDIYRKLDEIKRLGVTILLIDENVQRSLELSDYAYVLESGRITLHGETKELLKNKDMM
ncbi:MAG: ABC transporter ATP-binding protein, partial [Candidatus Bathyarchaeia archaeon]